MTDQLVFRTSKTSKYHLTGLGPWSSRTACASRTLLPGSGLAPADVPEKLRCTQLELTGRGRELVEFMGGTS